MISRRLRFILIGLPVLAACSHNQLDVSTENVQLNVRYTNLDSLLWRSDTTQLLHAVMEQRTRIPDIIDYELGYCWNAGSVTDPLFTKRAGAFRMDPFVRRVEQRIGQKFLNLPERHKVITEAFKYLKVHLPNAKLPKEVVYMNSYFASSAFCTENEIAIGLERYLGAKTDVIAELPPQEFFPWIKQKMDAQYLERDAVAAWIMSNIVEEKENVSTIEAMIRWGKIMYLTEAAFPEKPKHWIMRYTESDYSWALKNEQPFWDYLVDQKLLFEKDEQMQANFLNDGPFTSGLPEKGPDRLGQFLGWRIVQSYMAQYDITLQQLMALPYTELLQEYEITS